KWVIVEKDWRKVRDAIVQSMTNFGYPYIVVSDGDYRSNRELLLEHRHDGRDLDVKDAWQTLRRIHLLWGRPVHIETIVEGKRKLLTFDGKDETSKDLS